MTTFLGTEKYLLLVIMTFFSIGSIAIITTWALRSTWTTTDVAKVALASAILVGVAIYFILFPAWPVTPVHMILS